MIQNKNSKTDPCLLTDPTLRATTVNNTAVKTDLQA